MDTDTTTFDERPSATRAFFRGALSGVGSGALMAGIVATLAPFTAWLALAGKAVVAGAALPTMASALGGAGIGATMLGALATTAPLLILATATFSGFMAARHALSDHPSHDRRHGHDSMTIVPAGVTAPVIYQSQQASPDTAEQAPAKSWVAQTARTGDSQSRVQQILANGSLSDKDRASAILAARDAASAEQRSH